MNKKTCTCVIPFYNEKERILSVLRIVTAIKHVDEIICVDDGSTDGTGNEIKKHFPRVKLLSLPKNRGKASAIKRCLPDVKGEYILLLDADLSNLKKMEIERAITGMMRNTQIDMIILRRRFDPWINKIVRGDLLNENMPRENLRLPNRGRNQLLHDGQEKNSILDVALRHKHQ